MSAQNAFTMVRPQGKVEAPAKAPRKTNHSRAPLEGHLRDVAPPQLHDKEASRARSIAMAAEVSIKQAARERGRRSRMSTPAERARALDRNKDKV